MPTTLRSLEKMLATPEHGSRASVHDRSIPLLIAAAVGALLFTCVAGAYLYSSTKQLIDAAGWVEHTQEVLTALQTGSQLTERIEYSTHLHVATGQDQELSTARTAAVRLQTLAVHLKMLVVDNPNQTPNVTELTACSADLSHALENWASRPEIPRGDLLRCQQTISLMTEQERRLLKERNDRSDHRSLVSFTTELGFVGVSLLTLVALFTALFRNASMRRRDARHMQRAHASLAKSVQALEEQAYESRLLTSSRDELQLCITLEQVFGSAMSSLARLLPGTSGSICMLNNSRHMVEVVCSWGESHLERPGNELFVPESCCGLRLGQPRWRRPGVSEVHCDHFGADAPQSYLCIPMAAHGETLGVLYLECADEKVTAVVEKHMDGLRQLLQLTGMAVGSLNLRKNLESQSIRDPLTGLFNRHFMEIALERELSRAARRKSKLAVFMIDVDHFKNFNDTFGHAAGDAVLKAAAEVYRASVRAEDVVCRYGGEEFTIILPEITEEAAMARAECVRRAIERLRVPLDHGNIAEVTVSVGVAMYPTDERTAEQLLRRADRALYQSKRQGRNRVTRSEGVAPRVEKTENRALLPA